MGTKIYYILLAFLFASFLQACDHKSPANAMYGKPLYFGRHISEDSAIDCSQLKDKMGDATEVETKVKGEVIGICPDKSCVLKVDMGDGTCMNVQMNNLPVSIPRDASGQTA